MTLARPAIPASTDTDPYQLLPCPAMHIQVDDLSGPEVIELLEEHLRNMYEWSPPESVHALDLAGLKVPEVTFWTIWESGALMGCGALKEIDPLHGEVKSMRTPSARRGKGAGRMMLEHILKVARQRGYRLLSLETGSQPGFEPARKLYERFGFEYCGPFGGYTADPNSAFMQLHLPVEGDIER
ncbi:MAG TPA: GNAT family N-acetyltransferase [Azoarcus taiwanensis]|nr:GNAT family N-acetyltransferase [Azoarcus taiwanensis]